ncbi:trehalose-phosphatase [Chelatococcus sp. SYSU_G07232]|uniref:Trehalose 6-phosphate phosphatase n=1 Tax=Chelatococcus albus TaxID=3047466 RepID=A0ABT7AHD9_9HYPH|nr:trehalose-phosphatase [Chelatococcus sp. SYSU_G07232]MDJ1158773.1 trehalose-phosphatase [Chelatococcus sp. SYSU_G07232]
MSLDDRDAHDIGGARVSAFLARVAAEPQRYALFFDIDGTLIEIAPTPDAVVVPAALPDQFRRLARRFGGAVAFLSGRTLAWIDRRFDAVVTAVGALHGIERRTAAGTIERRVPPAGLDLARRTIDSAVAAWPGVLVEDKGLAVAVHYRSVPERGAVVDRLIADLAAGSDGALEALPGKAVAELRTAGAHKGTALEAFLAERPFLGRLPVFFGDDVTDQDGFAAARMHGGVAIAVGRSAREVGADFALPDPVAVRAFVARAVAPVREGETV